MKFLTASKRSFPAIGINKASTDYLGTGLTTKEVEICTGYRGRGVAIETKTFPVGTKVNFSLKEVSGKAYLTIEVIEVEGFSKTHDFNKSLEEVASELKLDSLPDYFKRRYGVK